MNTDKARRLTKLANQLSETLMTAAIFAQEIHTEIIGEFDGNDAALAGGYDDTRLPDLPSLDQGPILCKSTLCVTWKGKSLHLGNTRAFSLLARLCRRPNHYVTHLDLLHEVWDDENIATATVRSGVRDLRRRLRNGGMDELAAAVRGHSGRYILSL